MAQSNTLYFQLGFLIITQFVSSHGNYQNLYEFFDHQFQKDGMNFPEEPKIPKSIQKLPDNKNLLTVTKKIEETCTIDDNLQKRHRHVETDLYICYVNSQNKSKGQRSKLKSNSFKKAANKLLKTDDTIKNMNRSFQKANFKIEDVDDIMDDNLNFSDEQPTQNNFDKIWNKLFPKSSTVKDSFSNFNLFRNDTLILIIIVLILTAYLYIFAIKKTQKEIARTLNQAKAISENLNQVQQQQQRISVAAETLENQMEAQRSLEQRIDSLSSILLPMTSHTPHEKDEITRTLKDILNQSLHTDVKKKLNVLSNQDIEHLADHIYETPDLNKNLEYLNLDTLTSLADTVSKLQKSMSLDDNYNVEIMCDSTTDTYTFGLESTGSADMDLETNEIRDATIIVNPDLSNENIVEIHTKKNTKRVTHPDIKDEGHLEVQPRKNAMQDSSKSEITDEMKRYLEDDSYNTLRSDSIKPTWNMSFENIYEIDKIKHALYSILQRASKEEKKNLSEFTEEVVEELAEHIYKTPDLQKNLKYMSFGALSDLAEKIIKSNESQNISFKQFGNIYTNSKDEITPDQDYLIFKPGPSNFQPKPTKLNKTDDQAASTRGSQDFYDLNEIKNVLNKVLNTPSEQGQDMTNLYKKQSIDELADYIHKTPELNRNLKYLNRNTLSLVADNYLSANANESQDTDYNVKIVSHSGNKTSTFELKSPETKKDEKKSEKNETPDDINEKFP